jgi:hypothetical protein
VKTCSVEGCNNPVWSKGVCKSHTSRQPLARTSSIKKSVVNKPKEVNPMHLFFMDVWKKRKHVSEVSGTPLGKEAMSTFFHHILPKSKYPEVAYDESNIILLTLDEHTNVENDIYRYEEINKRRESLKLKYEGT